MVWPCRTSTQTNIGLTEDLQAETVLRYASLRRLPAASPENQEHLRGWLQDPDGGHQCFQGAEGLVWRATQADDLASLAPWSEKKLDAFTTFINQTILPAYHHLLGYRHRQPSIVANPFPPYAPFPTPIWTYRDQAITTAVNACSTLLASMIPALSALALFYIKSAEARMGAIVGLTFVFSAVVAMITNGGRTECFVATSAFAAVLVVFVGADGGGCSC